MLQIQALLYGIFFFKNIFTMWLVGFPDAEFMDSDNQLCSHSND
jgi:hypothetical protein